MWKQEFALNIYSMENEYCSDCKLYTQVVYDNSAGDTICSECGLVLESHSIDEKAEWRNYIHEPDDEHDPVRAGDKNNPLLSSGGLGTVIEDPIGSSLISKRTGSKPWQYKNDKKDINLVIVFKRIEQMADNLGLVETIKDYAKELYKKAEDGKILGRLRNTRASMAACLYLACQEEGFPRTIKEIHAVAVAAKVKEIHKVMELLKKHLGVGKKITHAKDIARRFCSHLGLNNHTIKAVLETLQRSEEFDVRRNCVSILAAIIYMVTQLSENYNKIHLQEVAQACEVAETTLNKAYKDLHPLALALIPNWYANAEDIKRICHL